MTHTLDHSDHSEDQAAAATHDVTGSAAARADDPVLSAAEVSALLGGVPLVTLAVEAWLQGRDREAIAWMVM
jgi:hypothetical protein